MKKNLILTTTLLLVTGLLKAQQDTISNGGFERWETFSTYSDPGNWYTLNQLTNVGYDPTTTVTSDAHSGNSAARLETKSGPSNDLPGLLTSGQIMDNHYNVDMNRAKYGFKSRPESISFYYKSAPVSGDSCSMIMALTKWDNTGKKADTIAKASVRIGTTDTVYTYKEIRFTYFSGAIPDSALILFSSSYNGYAPIVGSVFCVDDVKLNYTTSGINEIKVESKPTVYPNPASQRIFVDHVVPVSLKLYDGRGKYMLGSEEYSTLNSINISELNVGLYFLHIIDEGNHVYYQRILIQ